MQISLHQKKYKKILPFVASLGLAACGGGGDSGSSDSIAAPADKAMFAPLTTYCVTSVESSKDGWQSYPMKSKNIDTPGNTGSYFYSSIVSPAGSTTKWDDPIMMTVPVNDYRGVTSAYVGASSGYGTSINQFVMGVGVPTTLSADSVACVSQVTRVETPINYFAGIPNAPQIDTTPTLNWRSYWDKNIPITELPGFHVDGFEFVSNYVPVDGQVFFNVKKANFPTPQDLSVCYLAPKTSKWDCQQPSIADQGTTWNILLRGVKQGVYVLNSLAPR